MTLIIVFTNIIVIVKNPSFKSKYSILCEFLNDIDNSSDLKPQNKNTKEKKQRCMTVLELYNKLLDKYFDEYCDSEKEKKSHALNLSLLI